jgi:ribose-phosphate pyrophosphokinase
MISLNDNKIEPTIFPDKTSQVWKLPDSSFEQQNIIVWEFENEAEIFHICQIADLLHNHELTESVVLVMPYLPYGRQDKDVTNQETFALNTFARIINSCKFTGVTFKDGHSKIAKKLIDRSIDLFPQDEIQVAIDAIPGCVLSYPDKGAFDRYSIQFGTDAIIGDKVRDQQTGYITNYEFSGNPVNKDILIIDDICDGGMTFRILARDLLKAGANSVNLYVTHGIFSKGLEVLREDGISRIFTKKGELNG